MAELELQKQLALYFITHVHHFHLVLPQLFLVFQEYVAYLGFLGHEDINIGLLALNHQTHASRCQGSNSGSCPFMISKFKTRMFFFLSVKLRADFIYCYA